jgi:A/G-specific adenine glycosylase
VSELPFDSAAPLPGGGIAALRRWLAPRLLSWFRANRRELPWRQDRDAYRIWVSEVMLQQTQTSTVVPYFHRFLDRFPTLNDLARADEQDVLRLWEGLGYYRRARDLLAAARLLVERHGGAIPADEDALAELPGMGRYTRNAVLSQAFDLRLPIVEANVQRVLSRVLGYEDDPRQTQASKRLWSAAEALLPARHVGDFNQALMELGSLVCTPTSPRCDRCPLAARCVARQQGRQEEIPARSPKPATTFVSEAAVVARRAGKVLLVRRPAEGRWANLWEFPHGVIAEGESAQDAAVRLARELAGIDVGSPIEVATIRHGITRYRITLNCFEAEHARGEFHSDFYAEAEWLPPDELASRPVSAPQRRLTKLLGERGRQRRLF